MTLVFAWVILPFVFATLYTAAFNIGIGSDNFPYALLASPFFMVLCTEVSDLVSIFDVGIVKLILINSGIYGGLYLLFRTLCLSGAERHLGRPGERG